MVHAKRDPSRHRRRGALVALLATVTMGLVGAAAWAQLPSSPELRQQFQETDRNGDGKIDREEFHRRSVEVFYFLDKDRKGFLVIADVKGLNAEVFKAANRRADGRLSLEEFINARFQLFDLADTNGDGVLTLKEVETYINKMR